MTIDVYSATGTKKGTLELPDALFGVYVNHGLIHQAVMLQQSNRRMPIAHAKNRSEVAGSTKKLFAQKGTGRARRGSVRSPLLRGGGKAFGPRSIQNYRKDMPKAMRHTALASCLSFQAKKGVILGLEDYPDTVKTKQFAMLLGKLPLKHRSTLFVLPAAHKGLQLSSRNVPGVKTILASYLNPEDVMHARAIVFVGDSIQRATDIFTKKSDRTSKMNTQKEETAMEMTPAKRTVKKSATKKPAAKKATAKKSENSSSAA